MGQIDIAMRQYLSDNERFADLFNGVFFRGKKVIKSEELAEASEVYGELAIDSEGKPGKSTSRIREI